MPTLNKQSCPTCGQSVNEREISLFGDLAQALVRVYYWCNTKNRHEFTRKEIKHLFNGNDNVIARFGDLVFFGGLVYKPGGKGSYGLNMERCKSFIKGELAITTKAYKNPLTKAIRYDDVRTIDEIKGLPEFLDEAREYIVKYL